MMIEFYSIILDHLLTRCQAENIPFYTLTIAMVKEILRQNLIGIGTQESFEEQLQGKIHFISLLKVSKDLKEHIKQQQETIDGLHSKLSECVSIETYNKSLEETAHIVSKVAL